MEETEMENKSSLNDSETPFEEYEKYELEYHISMDTFDFTLKRNEKAATRTPLQFIACCNEKEELSLCRHCNTKFGVLRRRVSFVVYYEWNATYVSIDSITVVFAGACIAAIVSRPKSVCLHQRFPIRLLCFMTLRTNRIDSKRYVLVVLAMSLQVSSSPYSGRIDVSNEAMTPAMSLRFRSQR